MRDNPKDIWNFEKRVQKGFHTQDFLLDARWSDDDILDTRLTRLQYYEEDSNIIQYEVTLKRYANDPKVLVDLIRRCKSVQEGSFGGWKIRAWYRGSASPWNYLVHEWTEDFGNDGPPYYNMYGGFNENVLHPNLGRRPVAIQTSRVGDVSVLLRRMQELNLDIAASEELNHLGDLEDWRDWGSDKIHDTKEWVWRKMGYCNISLWIKGKEINDDLVVRWKKGEINALENALVKIRRRGEWEKLNDGDGVVYFNRNPKSSDTYKTGSIYDLQKKVEADPAYFISLVLEIK
jgi:hypothetical protein